MKKDSAYYGNYLIILLTLFSFRVFAQMLQATYPVSFLPAFDAWHSGSLPYKLLLTSQLIIIGVCGLTVWCFKTRRVKPSQRIGVFCLSIGTLYFAVMVFRLIAGFGFAADHPWFSAHIPTLFHLILASFLLVAGFYHNPPSYKLWARLIYPLVIGGALVTHYLCTFNDINLYIATYIPVLVAAALISYFEKILPYRPEWQPDISDITNDAGYMVLVQVLLPRFFSLMIVLSLAGLAKNHSIIIHEIWPHTSSIALQALLMLLIADFLRYWLHRLSHRWKPLWKLHEVHHSPKKLYWMNVGRFHPLEKGIQYVFDALPFIALGVSQEVLAFYFVFYAINGFFQHCNIELRLGFLNYLISGPELHRWHHSKHIHESDNNFGNNLIIWDWVFSTRYLPSNRSVGNLGVLDDNYPTTFSAQFISPFINTKKS